MSLCLFSPFNTSGFLKLSGRQSGLGNLFKRGIEENKMYVNPGKEQTTVTRFFNY